ncbi:MAG: elongation factor G, partial [Deltaproteobacteria bacterium]|nr:elongation factor G [Deltaproteobacteria bacterium]
PLDVPPIQGQDPSTGRLISRPSDEAAPLAALVFKIHMDQGRKLAYVRVYSGSLRQGQALYNPRLGATEKVARVLRMHANQRQRLEEARAGDIVAVLGLKSCSTGDTLCFQDNPILLEPIDAYKPVISLAVEPRSSADQDKVWQALDRLAEEDPTFHVHTDEETGQVILSGMGELHLEVIVHRLEREHNLAVNVGRPQVVYRETITASAEADEVFDREVGGSRQWARLAVRLTPAERGAGNSFKAKPEAAKALPPPILEAVREAAIESLGSGAVLGYPVVDAAINLIGAEFREQTSTELAFRASAGQAVRRAIEAARPALLEPIMALEVIVPEEFLGEVLGDLNARKGRVEKLSDRGGVKTIEAAAPLSRMFGYATALRSASQGRGTFTMQFSRYDLSGD